ncbi:hypothetical protein SGFS_014790 [Streptomyces graminofaciens]|uniref:Uncharacterized protein n=2 Tax=Streptomyces graminofaciens TaxID=68212 RepID=A0ABM9SBS0_9ACTN|nr:hypothetical protein SGFS_014790 [Streptomyces graminofaciens]
MAVHEHPNRSSGFRLPSFRRHRAASAAEPAASAASAPRPCRHAPPRTATHTAPAYALASLRLLTGFVLAAAAAAAAAAAGDTLGLGSRWAELPLVRRSRRLR